MGNALVHVGLVSGDVRVKGFTLIELAVVIGIIGLIMATVVPGVASQYQAGQMKETRRDMRGIEASLLGFVVVNHRLPCADTNSDGLEDCPVTTGGLPWQTLSVKSEDSWNNSFRYDVTAEFTYPTQAGVLPGPLQLDLTDTGDITVGGSSIASVMVASAGINGAWGDPDDIIIWLSPFVVFETLQAIAALP